MSLSELALNQRVGNAGNRQAAHLWLQAMNNHKQAQGKDS